MNRLMAGLADKQGFTAACCHPLYPEGFCPLAWSMQVGELADMVHLTAC